MPRKEPVDQDPLIVELDDWIHLITTPAWKHFIRILREHQQYLEREMRRLLKGHQDRLAGEARAKLEDVDKILQQVQRRLDELKKKKEGGK